MSNQKILQTLHSDVSRGDFFHTINRDFRELKEFMFDEQGKERLAGMRPVRRFIVTAWWLFKSLFFKLTPARRILLVAGLTLVFISKAVIYTDDQVRVQGDTNALGIICILFVLILELKDKLVAKRELEAGRAIQEALAPEASPSVAGWDLWLYSKPANDVGGDLVDFVSIEQSRYGIALADVAGKGLPAALLAAKLQSTLRAIVAETPSLAALGGKLNTIFCRDCLPSIFASFIYFEFTSGSGRVKFLNAGHLPPLLIKNGEVIESGKGGAAIGLMASTSFREEEMELQTGECIIAFSDGVIEAKNEFGEFYGEQRLRAIISSCKELSAVAVGERMLHALDQFVGTSRVHDDLSFVILRRP